MGFLDKAKEMLGQHDDKVDQGLDRAGEAAKQKFQGHDDMIDKATEAGKNYDFNGGQRAEGQPPAEEPPAAR